MPYAPLTKSSIVGSSHRVPLRINNVLSFFLLILLSFLIKFKGNSNNDNATNASQAFYQKDLEIDVGYGYTATRIKNITFLITRNGCYKFNLDTLEFQQVENGLK